MKMVVVVMLRMNMMNMPLWVVGKIEVDGWVVCVVDAGIAAAAGGGVEESLDIFEDFFFEYRGSCLCPGERIGYPLAGNC